MCVLARIRRVCRMGSGVGIVRRVVGCNQTGPAEVCVQGVGVQTVGCWMKGW